MCWSLTNVGVGCDYVDVDIAMCVVVGGCCGGVVGGCDGDVCIVADGDNEQLCWCLVVGGCVVC